MKKSLNIWKDILEKNFSSECFPNASSIEHSSKKYKIQLFELLVAETLNLHDRSVVWKVTTSGHDHGIDLIGHEKYKVQTPFIQQYELISLGQIKRKTSSYRYDDFKNDLFKVNEYCKDSDFFNKYSLKQFLFILSSDNCNSLSNIQHRFQSDTNSSLKMLTLSYIGFIDANELFLSWKNNYNYFKHLLENVLTDEEMVCFKQFVDTVDGNWISVSVMSPKEAIVNMPLEQTIILQTDNKELGLDVLIKWHPEENSDIQLLHPLPMYDPRKKGYQIHVSGKREVRMLFRSSQSGKVDFGKIEICSLNNQFIAEAKLDSVNIKDGLSFCYYNKPNEKIYSALETHITKKEQDFLPILICGNGGIGKSTLISEIYSHAVSRGYTAFDIAQPTDNQHGRFVLRKFFRDIIDSGDEEYFFSYDIPAYIYKFLGNGFNKDWIKTINDYFHQNSSEINTSYVAECLGSCIIRASLINPVFIWLSNLQWASPETITIFTLLLDELYNNLKWLGHKVLILFEGRSNENLILDNQNYYPAHWDAFIHNDLLKTYELETWSEEHSREFITHLFQTPNTELNSYESYLDTLLNKTSGNPMHIIELIRHLFEENKLKFNDQNQLVILNSDISDISVKDIQNLIKKRIAYYRLKVSNYIDILIIIAKLNGITSYLYHHLVQFFCSNYNDLEELLQQSGFGAEKNNLFVFSHENYLTVFRNSTIINEDITKEVLRFYSNIEESESVVLKCIVLKRNLHTYNLSELRKEIITILPQVKSIQNRILLYNMLLELPVLKNADNDLSKAYILFQLCELQVQDGNWENGISYLQEILKITNDQNYHDVLYKLKAKQELANILADILLLDQSIKEAQEGIEFADINLDCGEFLWDEVHNIKREREKLRARLAVCYWFSGDLAKAYELQEQALTRSQETYDTYAASHVLYEKGTLELHWNVTKGINTIKKSKEIGKDCTELEEEKTLIEVQLLIGLLIKAIKENDIIALGSIKNKVKYLINGYKSTPHVYEEFLCYTIEGICLVKQADYSNAMTSFLNSLKKATESHMKNLEWKALFNIAQLYSLDGISSSAQIYAKRTNEILNCALISNPMCNDSLQVMFAPVKKRINFILENEKFENIKNSTDVCPMLAIEQNEYLFVIMN